MKRRAHPMKRDGVKRANPKPMKRASKRQASRTRSQFGPHAASIRELPCELCGTTEGISAHHTLHRKHLGWARHLVPLCGSGTTGCHGKMHAAWDDQLERARTIHRLDRRAAQLWAESPHREKYCEHCALYVGRKACPKCGVTYQERAA